MEKTKIKEYMENRCDCIICDLPYGTTKCSWDVVIPFEEMWKELKRLRKDETPIILFGVEPFASYLRISNIKEFKYDWRIFEFHLHCTEQNNSFLIKVTGWDRVAVAEYPRNINKIL